MDNIISHEGFKICIPEILEKFNTHFVIFKNYKKRKKFISRWNSRTTENVNSANFFSSEEEARNYILNLNKSIKWKIAPLSEIAIRSFSLHNGYHVDINIICALKNLDNPESVTCFENSKAIYKSSSLSLNSKTLCDDSLVETISNFIKNYEKIKSLETFSLPILEPTNKENIKKLLYSKNLVSFENFNFEIEKSKLLEKLDNLIVNLENKIRPELEKL